MEGAREEGRRPLLSGEGEGRSNGSCQGREGRVTERSCQGMEFGVLSNTAMSCKSRFATASSSLGVRSMRRCSLRAAARESRARAAASNRTSTPLPARRAPRSSMDRPPAVARPPSWRDLLSSSLASSPPRAASS